MTLRRHSRAWFFLPWLDIPHRSSFSSRILQNGFWVIGFNFRHRSRPSTSSHTAALIRTLLFAVPFPNPIISSRINWQSSFKCLSSSMSRTREQSRVCAAPSSTRSPPSRQSTSIGARLPPPNDHALHSTKRPSSERAAAPIIPLLFSIFVFQLSLISTTTLITISILKYHKANNNNDPGPIIGALLSLVVMLASAFGAWYESGQRKERFAFHGSQGRGSRVYEATLGEASSGEKGTQLRDLPCTVNTGDQSTRRSETVPEMPAQSTFEQSTVVALAPSHQISGNQTSKSRTSKTPRRSAANGVPATAATIRRNQSLKSTNSFATAPEQVWL